MQAETSSSVRGASTPMEAFAARSLYLLKAIESTIDKLASDVEILQMSARDTHELLHSLKAAIPPGSIDAAGRATHRMGECLQLIGHISEDAQNRHRAACGDARLTPHDGVQDAYQEYIAAIVDLQDVVFDLKEWVETHDALLEPVIGPVFESADQLFKAILATP